MKPIEYFEREEFFVVSKINRENAIAKMSTIMDYYPPISASVDDYSIRKNFELFYAKLKNIYPEIFLMDMYGINYIWSCIDNYYKHTKDHNLKIKDAAVKIYEILIYLYNAIPSLKRIDEMPTISVEEAGFQSLSATIIKDNTEDKVAKKVQSAFSLAKDVCDSVEVSDVYDYYTRMKNQLDKEYLLKNNTRCEFEDLLYKKCLDELEKCKVAGMISAASVADNIKELVKKS